MIVYGLIFSIFVTVLFLFHVNLISDFKSTQEKLKKDKGISENTYSMNPYSYQSGWTNWIKTLCSRRNKYYSKISWEFYQYSKGETDILQEFWKAQEKRGSKDTKIFDQEKSIDILSSSRS